MPTLNKSNDILTYFYFDFLNNTVYQSKGKKESLNALIY